MLTGQAEVVLTPIIEARYGTTYILAMSHPRLSPKAHGAGLRERNKLDKQRRILKAAREVFLEFGYDTATTRAIAARAEVSIGTIFVYASDKRDLLLQIVNDDLDAVNAKARVLAEQPGTLLERLLAYFSLRYRYWASEPRLARPVLRETFDFLDPYVSQSEETKRFFARRPLMLQQIEEIVRSAQAAGEVVPALPATEIASLIFSLYLLEVRRWLGDPTPHSSAGIERLGQVLDLFTRGIMASSGAPTRPARKRKA